MTFSALEGGARPNSSAQPTGEALAQPQGIPLADGALDPITQQLVTDMGEARHAVTRRPKQPLVTPSSDKPQELVHTPKRWLAPVLAVGGLLAAGAAFALTGSSTPKTGADVAQMSLKPEVTPLDYI